jgi:uncharacterized protein
MGENKAQLLAETLDGFVGTSADVEAAAVVSFDGLTMASALPDEMDDDRVGAMSAALLSLGEQAARGLGRGDLQQLFVEADDGYVFLMSARDQAVLVAVTGRHAKIGFILYEMRRAAADVGAVLEARAATQLDEPVTDAAFAALTEPVTSTVAHGEGDRSSADDEPGMTAPSAPDDDIVAADPPSARDPFGDSDLDDPAYVTRNGDSSAYEARH